MALNMQCYVVTLIFTLIIQCTASDLYSDLVRKYDADTFKLNIGGDQPHFVNFFAPWCGYCKRLKPVWDELAEKYNVDASNQKLIVAKIDCTVETPLCADQGVSGYPSLIFYNVGNSAGIKYKGKRDLAALEEFISSNIEGKQDNNIHPVPAKSKNPDKSGAGAVELSDQDFHKTIDWGMHFVKFYAPWCGHCQKLAPIWDDLALSSELDLSVTISKIDCTANRLSCGEFEVKAFPTLLWIVNGKKVEKYQGQRTLVDLKRFITDMKKTAEETMEVEDGKIPDTPVELTPIVVHLTEANFENAVAHGITFVKFFAPWCGHCRRLAPTWDELARKFVSNTQVKIAKVDCTSDEDLCNKHKVQGYPTLFLFRNGQSVAEFNGIRDLESLYGFVQDHVGHDEL